MPTIKLVPSTYYLSNSTYLSVSNTSNMYNDTDNDTYATVTNTQNGTTSYYIYLRGFNFDDVPSNAEVTSMSIKLKARESGISTSTNYAPKLCHGTSQLTSTFSAISTTATVLTATDYDVDFNDIKGYGDQFGIRINCRRSNRNTTGYVYIYGAEIEVTYTIPVYHNVVASSLVSGVAVTPATQSIREGEDAVITFNVDDIGDYSVTDNDVDVTNELVRHEATSGGTLENVLGSYELVSGSFNGSGASYFSGLVGNGHNASQTTSNYYSGGSGTIAVFTYDMPFTNIPSNATITRVYCLVNGHAESTSNSSEYMCAQLISGSTDISEELNFKNVGTSNSTQTLEATTIPTIAQLAALKLQCRLGYYGGAINGATCYVEYTTPASGHYYTYTIINVLADHVIILDEAEAYIPPEEDPQYTYQSITISSINATTDPENGTTRVVEGSNQVITITPEDPQLTLALDNGVDITSQLVGGVPTNTYTVTTQVQGASYGFNLNSSSGYYVSTNNGVSKSASVARLNLDFESDCLLTIQYINYAEENYDYGMFGKLDTTVSTSGLTAGSGGSSPADSTSNYQLARCTNSSSAQTITYTVSAGEHYIDIKYGKDDASDSNNDNLQWKVLSIEPTSAGGAYTYTLTNITQKHSLIFVFGDVDYYFVTSTGSGCRLFPDGQTVKLDGDSYILNIVPDDVTATVTLSDNGVDKTAELEKLEGTDKQGNPVVSYRYSLSSVTAAHNLIISSEVPVTTKLYAKIDGAWAPFTKAFIKVNGSWVAQSDLTLVFNSTGHYEFGGEIKPLYSLDGTYVNTENDTQIVIENGHWHITAQYTGGTKTINLFQFPAAAVSGQRAWKGVITNFHQITSGGGMGGINGANDWSQSYEICSLASGDQENSIQITPTSPDVRLWYLRYSRPYGAAFECEFDFKLYVNDIWYC